MSIMKKCISVVLATALMSLYCVPGISVLCSGADGTKKTACCSSGVSGRSQCTQSAAEGLSVRSVHKCPCTSFQSLPDKSIDEVLPNSVKTDCRYLIATITLFASRTHDLSKTRFNITSSAPNRLSTQDFFSLLQTFRI